MTVWTLFLRLAVVFFALFAAFPAFATDPDIENLENKPLPEIKDPDVQKVKLKNGMSIYYLRDPELPVIRIKAYFEFGELNEPRDERGLVPFFMSAWRAGGYGEILPEQVDEVIEFHAAKMSANAGDELSSFELKTLQKHADKMLSNFFGIMRFPAFDKNRVEIIRKAFLNEIRQRNEEPFAIATREFAQSLYGHESPHAWMSTPETVKAISRERLLKFHADHVDPGKIWLAATSPLPLDEFKSLIEKYTGDWKQKAKPLKKPDPVEKKWEPTLEFIHKPGNQSAIVVGHFGEKRFNPDRFKILLANQILGGATFGSRLGDRIRTELGLAYGVNSYFDFETDYGIFQVATRTKSESTVETVREILKILKDSIKKQAITQTELNLARERLLNQLVFEYDSSFNLVNLELKYDYFGYPPDYLSLFPKKIRSVTLDELHEALPRYVFPDRLKILIVGDKTAIGNLGDLGAIKEILLDEE